MITLTSIERMDGEKYLGDTRSSLVKTENTMMLVFDRHKAAER